jgi:type III pantothenate kinase
MRLLVDIGNTHTHLALASSDRVGKRVDISTTAWSYTKGASRLREFVGRTPLEGASLCSVVPSVTRLAKRALKQFWDIPCLELSPETVRGIGINYPKPKSIGADRLANAVAARHLFGAPVIALDFGTALTLDVVDAAGNFVGGIIAPGLAVMTEYLHEKTALLPKIKVREVKNSIGKSTKQAMLIGAVHGYRGLVRELLIELIRCVGKSDVPVVATGSYVRLLAPKLPEITAVEPLLTLEGLRLLWQFHHQRV